MRISHGCPTELGELDVPGFRVRSGASSCANACRKLTGKGNFCCEYQTDWGRCLYQTRDTRMEYLGSWDRARYATMCSVSGRRRFDDGNAIIDTPVLASNATIEVVKEFLAMDPLVLDEPHDYTNTTKVDEAPVSEVVGDPASVVEAVVLDAPESEDEEFATGEVDPAGVSI